MLYFRKMTCVSSLSGLQAFGVYVWKLAVNKVVLYFLPVSDVVCIAMYKGGKEMES